MSEELSMREVRQIALHELAHAGDLHTKRLSDDLRFVCRKYGIDEHHASLVVKSMREEADSLEDKAERLAGR